LGFCLAYSNLPAVSTPQATAAFTRDGWVHEQAAPEKIRNGGKIESSKASCQTGTASFEHEWMLASAQTDPIVLPPPVVQVNNLPSQAPKSEIKRGPRPLFGNAKANPPPSMMGGAKANPPPLAVAPPPFPAVAPVTSLPPMLPPAPLLAPPVRPEPSPIRTVAAFQPIDDATRDARPPIDRPLISQTQPPSSGPIDDAVLYRAPMDAPIGYTGPSGVLPRDTQTGPRFVPVEDRWRIGIPRYDRYGKNFPPVDDYLYRPGSIQDPFNQNVLKGDYPILGQNIFLEITGESRSIIEPRQQPVATTPFESTRRAYQEPFFGNPSQLSFQQFFLLSFDLFHGDASFRPMDWRVKVTPVFNMNYITLQELAVVNPDVRLGRERGRTFFALEEWFLETKLADLGPNYDFVSARIGSQFFNSDFRGFIFTDVNRAARIFGTRNSNREQFNLAYFAQLEKDTNSELNTFRDRDQGILIANYFIQDFIWPGYTTQFSFHYNHDDPTVHFDKNNVLVRPDPIGVFQPHGLDVFYLGWAGDGHINRLNINHAFYYAFGKDYLNPIANRGVDISAGMGAIELSYDRDYVRFRTSMFWASGDQDPRNGTATGFDAIFDNPQFAGGEFSYWQRQSIRLFGVNLVNRESFIPNLRSSKIQGQSNFVNPGLFLANAGMDIEITPRCRMINNVNFLWFDNTAVLRQYAYAAKIDQSIGTDISTGFEYRPLLSNNVIIKFGASALLPSQGFYDLYNNPRDSVSPLVAGFMDVILQY